MWEAVVVCFANFPGEVALVGLVDLFADLQVAELERISHPRKDFKVERTLIQEHYFIYERVLWHSRGCNERKLSVAREAYCSPVYGLYLHASELFQAHLHTS